MSMVKLGVIGLSFFLAFAYFMAGVNKLGPLHAPTHAMMVDASQAWPEALHLDGTGLDATTLRVAIGLAEVLGAVLLLTPAATNVAVGLMLVMAGAVYTHARLDQDVTPPAVFLLLLGVLVALRVMLRREAAAATAAAVAAQKAD